MRILFFGLAMLLMTGSVALAQPAEMTALDLYNRGVANYEAKKLDLAVADLTKALDLETKDVLLRAKAYVARALAKTAQNDHPGAIADYTHALELIPKSSTVYNNRAAARSMINDLDGALADYSKAIELKPTDPRYYRNRAGIYRKLGKTALAEIDETKATELESK